ncbi:unnamed protein product [Cuscuta europaea]|uniref:C2H2-type domain-containing protein n=2 Tax=Cuscuta europaea TaxID=41803 RepID=A0A9P0Z6Z9_CUSEU|nr:unnamed protein product [Cuscuta europaea]
MSTEACDFGTLVDPKHRKYQCKYCSKVVTSLTRLKFHLGGIHGEVIPCPEVPAGVREMLRNELLQKRFGKVIKDFEELNLPTLPLKRNRCESPSKIVKQESIQTHCSGTSTNPNPETHFTFANNVKESAFPIRQVDPPLNEAQKCTGRFFYGTGVNSPSKIVKQESIQTPCSGTPTNPNPETHFTFANNVKDSAFLIRQVDPPLSEAQKCIGRFFYETGVDFETAKSPSFQKMIKSINGSVEIPTYHELKGRILQEAVKEMQDYTSHIKNVWAATGCSILLDGWVDSKGRKLLIILVDCPSGTIFHQCADISSIENDVVKMEAFLRKVIEEVGVDNLVQIVSYSTSSFIDDVVKRVNEKCKTVFWTVSASHCIELMLRKLETMNDVKEILGKAKSITQFVYSHDNVLKLLRDFCPSVDELMKPSKIRSIVPFLTLENMVMEKGNLQRIFLSSLWKTLECARTGDGQRVVDLVGDKTFWEGALMVLKATIPLVNVLKLINSSNKPQIGSIYDTIDQVKETIKSEFKNKKSQYVKFWEAIDEIWNKHLHSPLHAAGYFLNPSIFYSSDFYDDAEVSCGLCCCIVRMTADSGVQDLIIMQIEQYRMGKGLFGVGSKDAQLENIDPANWWSKYGRECPELQRLAIRILNQTCNGASKYNLKRTLAEALLTQRRNKTEQARLKDLVFVHYNMHLQNFWADENNDLSNVEVDPMDDWIVRRQPSTVNKNGEPPVIDLESEESATSKIKV